MKQLLLMLILLTFAPIRAASVLGSEFDFLPRGARALAMGGTGCASSLDAFALFYNPAAMSELPNPQAIVEYSPLWNLGDDFGTGSLVYPLDTRMAVGAYYSRLEVNDIPYFGPLAGTSDQDRYNNIDLRSTGQPDGYFYDSYDVFNLSIAKWYETRISQENFYKLTIPVTLSAGLSLKYFRQRFSFSKPYEGHATDLDGGLLFSFILDKNLANGKPTKIFKTGLSLKNMLATNILFNSDADYKDAGERIRTFALSYTQQVEALQGGFDAAIDFVRRGGDQENRYGLEYFFRDKFCVRAGYLDHGITAGMGLRYKGFSVDYAFRAHALKNNPYQISLSYALIR